MKRNMFMGLVPIILLGVAMPVGANVNTITGGLNVGLDLDHRSNRGGTTSSASRDYNNVSTTPTLIFSSSDIDYGVDFKYAPSFKYDLNGNGTSNDQNLNLNIHKLVVKEWQVRFNESYVKSDDVNQANNALSGTGISGTTATTTTTTTNATTPPGLTADQISNELGRRKYWTNNSSITSDYTYLPDSVFTFGYIYSLFRNDQTGGGGYQDYDKHTGLVSVSYRFLPEWKAIVGGQFVRGLYGTQQSTFLGSQSDLKEYHGNMSLESYIFTNNVLSLSYGYVGTRYDDPARNNSDIYNLTAGWKRNISPHLNIDLGAGPSYSTGENRKGTWGYNGHAHMNYLIEHGSLNLGIDKTYSQDNFSGTSTGGTVDAWTLSGAFSYQLYEHLSSGVFASYADQNRQGTNLSTVSSYKQKVYSTGLSLNYGFWRWYTATLGYTFTRQEADVSQVSSYDDNRFYLTIGAQTELFRW